MPDSIAGTRAFPQAKPETTYAPRFLRDKKQRQFRMDTGHRAVWASLLAHAEDLSVTPAVTLHSREHLAQFAGLTGGMLDYHLAHLESQGLIYRQRRPNKMTNRIYLFFTPYDPSLLPPMEQQMMPLEDPVLTSRPQTCT